MKMIMMEKMVMAKMGLGILHWLRWKVENFLVDWREDRVVSSGDHRPIRERYHRLSSRWVVGGGWERGMVDEIRKI
ncbi:unnamed protein product [Prunus armeniaca]|uniref:Uncharacterized protein n=1 Tax=Prunus armeniaca TaxID=36596 RepID=A0A6J5XDE0_PRUAR|nr:unnamed protein product [Prunus armeniaca]